MYEKNIKQKKFQLSLDCISQNIQKNSDLVGTFG